MRTVGTVNTQARDHQEQPTAEQELVIHMAAAKETCPEEPQ